MTSSHGAIYQRMFACFSSFRHSVSRIIGRRLAGEPGMDRASSQVPECPTATEGGSLDQIIARHFADPAVAAVLVNHDGRLWIKRDDGRLVSGTVIVPRPEVERFVGAVGPRTTPRSKRG